MRNVVIGIVVLVLLGGGVFAYQQMGKSATYAPLSTPNTNQPVQQPTSGSKTVTYSDSGYAPLSVSVKAGETVTFVNESDNPLWTASALHPTHTIYPGTDIGKCGTPEAATIFDACRGYNKGESWSFVFSEKGTWKYHNHLNAGHVGTVVVQ